MIQSNKQVIVGYDYDTRVNFKYLKSYSWNPLNSEIKQYELITKRVIREVNKILKIKWFKEVSTKPDFLIALSITKQQKVDVTDWEYSNAHGQHWARGGKDVTQHEEGTLFLDFIDVKSMELIWRGTATAIIDLSRTPEEREKLVREGISGMLKNFPPPRK